MVKKSASIDASRPAQPIYLPAIVPPVGIREHSLSKYVLAIRETTDRPCGLARRLGYTGPKATYFALYRLKMRDNPSLQATTTLSGFFILENDFYLSSEASAEGTYAHTTSLKARCDQHYYNRELFFCLFLYC